MDEAPDPQRLIKLARQTLSSAERRKRYSKIDFLDESFWYSAQKKFFEAGARGVHQRLIHSGNQRGKSTCCAAEVVWHAAGRYPSWWVGHRFKKPPLIWVVTESVIVSRETVQKILLGSNFGEGLIPLEAIAKKPIMVAGGMNAVDVLFVHHVDAEGNPDGVTQIVFKSYEQRREKLQGATVDLIWCDEQPPEDVYSELLARTSASDEGRGGHVMVSFTPVGKSGAAGVTYKYLSEYSADRIAIRIPSEEAEHISAERSAELADEYSEEERESRIEGTPQLGSGQVYPIELLPSIVRSFNPDTLPLYARWCVGIDFGATAFAAVMIAWQPDVGLVWVVDSFQAERSSALYHVQRIHSMTRGLRMAVAWPQDGLQTERASGQGIITQYIGYGLNAMKHYAVNGGTGKDNSVEPGISRRATKS